MAGMTASTGSPIQRCSSPVHNSVHAWVGKVVDRYGLANKPTLEIGSYDENGSVRDLFCGPYLGIDSRSGPGVDIVMDGEYIPRHIIPGQQFDVIVCTEVLEHVERPWRVVQSMADTVQPDGFIILTARGYDPERGFFPYHAYPSDHYRFGPGALDAMVEDYNLTILESRPDPQAPGWFLLARNLL
jgi:SAM-dependent methyltransferase